MKRNLISLLSVILAFAMLAGCTSNGTKSSSSMLEAVMDAKGKWETYDGKYCIYIQLRQSDGSYVLTCGYDDKPLERTNEAVSTFSPEISVSYDLTESSVGEGYVDKMLSAYDSLYGPEIIKLIGNTAYYYNDSDSQKHDIMESLFAKINGQQ